MNKNQVAVLIAIIGAVATLGGGAASGVITIDMFNTDNSNTDIRGDTNISGDTNVDTTVNVDGKGITCSDLKESCKETNVEGALKVACEAIDVLCWGE